MGRKGLARTSASPGRTRIINFFEVDSAYLFVDLPGYGFARVSRELRDQWGPMIEEFLTEEEQLKLAVVILDVRRAPSHLDALMIDWLRRHRVPFQLVATKTDKLSGNRRRNALTAIEKHFGMESVLPFSSRGGAGRRELWSRIKEAVTES